MNAIYIHTYSIQYIIYIIMYNIYIYFFCIKLNLSLILSAETVALNGPYLGYNRNGFYKFPCWPMQGYYTEMYNEMSVV